MSKKITHILHIILCLVISACNEKFDNSKELTKVIDHYSVNPADSLKMKAAIFLIENLKNQLTLDTTSVKSNQVYFDLIYNTWKHEKMRVGFRLPIQTRVIDSLNKVDKLPQKPPQSRYFNEADVIKADFLIKNIDDAFYAWKNMPWSKKISFDDFCEYILPYRSSVTYSLDSRKFFLNRYRFLKDSVNNTQNSFVAAKFIFDDINKWFAEDPNILSRYPYLYPIKFSNLLKAKFGDCQDAHSLRIAAFRALGIPVTMDEIPNWGNSNQPHYWYKIIDPKNDTIKSKITNKNIFKTTQYIISSSSFDDSENLSHPNNVEVKYGRTIPKVYRRCFKKQKNSLAAIKSINDEIPPYFENAWLKDVTENYLETADVKLKINSGQKNNKYVYLCVFDNQKWVPVAWAENKNMNANFRAMGKNIVYLPVFYKNHSIVAASNPFLLKDNGEIENIKFSKNREKVKLFAKFPTRTYVLANENSMVGGRFQFANKEDLSDTTTINTVKNLPIYQTELKINDNKKYRFLIFQFKGIPITQMSELSFFGLKNGKEIKLNGKLIGSKGSYPYKVQNLFDEKRTSYFKSAREDKYTYVGIDLGQNNAQRITRILYVPHNDDNNVFPNETYQLFYWDKEWVSIGLENGEKNNSVSFTDVPKGALLLLKNMSGGVEERIFRYNRGKQEFW